MYRITNQRYTDTTIAAVQRGVPVRLIHEPDEYRNPARQWDSWNVDRMYMAGVQIKMRKHLGLNHQKSVVLYGKGMTIFGSSNWTGPSSNSQEEHNYFTTKQWFFQWFVDQFERKWNSASENIPFVPGIPEDPTPPVAGEWRGGPTDDAHVALGRRPLVAQVRHLFRHVAKSAAARLPTPAPIKAARCPASRV